MPKTPRLTATGRYKVDVDTLRKALPNLKGIYREMCELRLEYTATAKLLSNYISKLETDVIYVEILPTQKTGRWSYFNPALNNFPRRCINPDCPTRS